MGHDYLDYHINNISRWQKGSCNRNQSAIQLGDRETKGKGENEDPSGVCLIKLLNMV